MSATQVLVDFNAGIDTRPVEMRFPVSAGIDHQTNDAEEEIPATNNSIVRYILIVIIINYYIIRACLYLILFLREH